MSGLDGLSPEKERQILDGAAAVFAEAGYEGASMSRIAAVAGVSKGTLYNYFAGKRDLFAAFMQRACANRLASIFDAVNDDVAPEATLTRICTNMMEMMVSEEGLLIYRMAVAEAAKFPELAEVFYAAGPQRALVRMTGWIARNAAAGLLQVDDAEFAAEQLFALVQTRLVLRRRLQLTQSVSDAEIHRVVTACVRLFMRGYGAPGSSPAALPAAP
jgi:AcrR family transcriptional regulator